MRAICGAVLVLGVITAPILVATHPATPVLYDPQLYERVLIPIYTCLSEGLHGSRWGQTVMVHNGSSEGVALEPDICHGPCPPPVVVPGATRRLPLELCRPSYAPGTFVFIPRTGADSVIITERIHELSQATLSFGTEIPVVREDEWITGRSIELLDVPLGDPAFRVMLRVYGAPIDGCHYEICAIPVQIQIYEQSQIPWSQPDELVGQTSTTIGFGHHWTGHEPAYAQFAMPGDHVERLSATSRYRLSIRSSRDDAPLWAFASITSNATQHVTIAAPRSR